MRLLLDTNIVIALLNTRHREKVAERLAGEEPGSVVTSVIVAHELHFGAARSSRPDENRRRLDTVLAELPPLPLTFEDARCSGEIRARLARIGQPIGPYDVLIAGQAMARGMTLVTNNSREFARIEGLYWVDWLT